MSIAKRGYYSGAAGSGGGSVALGLQAGSAAVSGDLEILTIVAPSAPSAPSGWTVLATQGNVYVYWRAYTSQNHTVTLPGFGIGLIIAYSGADTVTPYASAGTGNNGLAAQTIARDGSLLLVVDGHVDGLSSNPAAPTGFTDSSLPPLNGAVALAGWSRTYSTATSTAAVAGNDPSGSTGNYVGIVLNQSPAVPYTPAPASPPPSTVADLNTGTAAERTFSWNYSDPQRGAQTGYALRRKIISVGSYEYWNATSVAWQAGVVYNTSSASSVTIPTTTWTSGPALWSVSTQNGAGNSPFAVDSSLIANVRPTVTVTGPTGTITATTRPTFAWTYADVESNPQTSYQVRVFTSAQVAAGGFDPAVTVPVADSGEQLGTAATYALLDVPNGTLVPYVRVGQASPGTGTYYGAWTAGASWTENVTLPSAPTSVVATTRPTTGDVSIAVTATLTGLTSPTITVERTVDGSTWVPVRGAKAVAALTVTTVIDREAPPAPVVVRYRARLNSIAGGTVSSTNTLSANNTLILSSWWLRDPTAAFGDLTFAAGGDSFDLTATESAGVFRALGRRTPVVVAEARATGGEKGTLALSLTNDGDYATLEALRTLQRTLLLLSPYGDFLYVAFPSDRVASYPLGAKKRLRTVTLPFVEVDQPAVTS